MLEAFFPNGVVSYALGGVLIGLGVSVFYLGTAHIVGASTVLESTLSYVSNASRFQESRFVTTRDWRVVFTLGIVGGAAIYAFTIGDGVWTTQVQPWRLAIGGFLVGIGTRLGKGCTSGHGVCGVGSLSTTSFTNVAIFLALAIGIAHIVQAFGVVP